MIIDMKYHIVSLVAVFMALGIGILIGTTMVGSDTIVNMQKQVTDRLEKNYDVLQRENKQARGKIAELEANARNSAQFAREVLPVVVGNRLNGLQMAVVETSNLTGQEEVLDTLKLAGVKVTSVTTLTGDFDAEDAAKLTELKTNLGLQGDKVEDVLGAASTIIFKSISTGDNLDKLQYLQAKNIIKTSGEYGVPLNGVIFIGGSATSVDDYSQVFDKPMIKAFEQGAVPVFGVETSDVPISYMKEYQRLKITTVDNVDTIPGQVALIYAIQNRPGHYGVKETAKKLLPALP